MNDEVNQMQEKIISLESKCNSVEQYGRRNNMEINGIPNCISDDNLEVTVVNLLSKVANVHVTADDMKHVTELVNPREIKKKLLFASLSGNIANVPQLIGRN